jgi:hypothetical protein
MKKIVLLVSVVALFAGSCVQDANIDGGVEKHRIVASIESSRTTLGADNSVLWSQGDELAVLAVMNDKSGGNIGLYTLVEGAGTSSAVFEGELSSYDTYQAFYPVNMFERGTISGQILFMMPPTGAIFTERSFVDGANPMYAVGTATSGLKFKNLCGILELQIKGKGTLSSIKIAAPHALSGYFLLQGDDTKMWGVNGYDQYGEVSATLSPAITLSENTPRSVYAIVPPQTYSQLTVTVTDTEGKSTTVTTNDSVVVERSKITPVTVFTHTGESGGDDGGGDDGDDDESSLEDPNENPDKEW